MITLLKRVLIFILVLIVTVTLVYLVGPRAEKPNFPAQLPTIDASIDQLDSVVSKIEQEIGEIKTDNEARIIWADSVGQKTEYAIVYLPGFGASQGEGMPVHTNIADSLKANLYLARLKGHGLSREDALVDLTSENYMESAMKAFSLGRKLGDKIILMGTSTGASQALYIASQFPDQIEALVLYSPFIELADANLNMLSKGPWSDKIAETMLGSDISYTERPDSVAAYWSSYYHVNAYKALFNMIHSSMISDNFKLIKQPVFMAYYYKDEEHQDDVVSVAAMKQMFEELSSSNKKSIAFPKAGDHVIASKLRSKDWRAVQDSTLEFLNATLY
ncbi:lipase [Marivirga atlantica]|jgi:pimeloyl-ACP methyl ester carboxylesterase|uniref:Alpha/beta hydrolase n=1 Tax=Marivirga atlantica TaxID=1548457 RepID=A0A937DK62_9BACT|nr:alpha/beta hydrolase [Marivirga atlantica]MBL0765906.1 alpha/beta hydrolase [Marivirga atlantica]